MDNPIGTTCSSGYDCASSYCVNGVCTDDNPSNPSGYICFQTKALTFENSVQAAATADAKLATIRCSEQNEKVTSLLPAGANAWIGGDDIDNEDTWMLQDGEIMTYSNWLPGEPSNGGGNENCLQIQQSSGRWNDSACGMSFSAVYESRSPIAWLACKTFSGKYRGIKNLV